MEIADKDKEKTASVRTAYGSLKLCNLDTVMLRPHSRGLMERVLKGLHLKTFLVYLYDIIVMERNFDEHLKNLGGKIHFRQ